MTTHRRPKVLRPSSPADLLAAVPVVLGFHPQESVVLLTFGSQGQGFHARVDLPPDDAGVLEIGHLFLGALERNRLRRVGLIIYTADAAAARRAVAGLRRVFRRHDVHVLVALRADGRRWFAEQDGLAGAGAPYDVGSHPYLAESVFEGTVTHASREALAATLTPVDDEVLAGVEAAALGVAARWGDPDAGHQWPAEAQWVHDLVQRHVAEGTCPGVLDLGRLLVALTDDSLCGVPQSIVSRETARRHERFWADVVRHTPVDWLAAPAALLALVAWLAGDGALAWCAIDRSRQADPRHRLADTMAAALMEAIPPSEWRPPARPLRGLIS